jgi:hypothetical protein
MQVVQTYPPNFEVILAAFPMAKNPGVMFTYGSVIHNPSGREIPIWLVDHEKVHCAQQGEDPAGWWEKYIADKQFRFAQELPAHRVEWRSWLKTGTRNRHERRQMMCIVGARLAGPLYGRMVDFSTARRMIEAGDQF